MPLVISNIKDTISTVCGWVIGICGAILAVTIQGVVIPPIVLTIAASAASIATVILGILTGKNPDGTTKSNPVNV